MSGTLRRHELAIAFSGAGHAVLGCTVCYAEAQSVRSSHGRISSVLLRVGFVDVHLCSPILTKPKHLPVDGAHLHMSHSFNVVPFFLASVPLISGSHFRSLCSLLSPPLPPPLFLSPPLPPPQQALPHGWLLSYPG